MKLNKQYTSYILFILGALLLAIGFSSCAKSEGNGSARLHGLYSTADDSLLINFPTVSQFDLQDPPYHFGEKNSKGYRIDEVSRKNLVLSCRDTLYHFHKF